MYRKSFIVALCTCAGLATAASAQTTVPLGGGWEAVIANPLANVGALGVIANEVHCTKTATFVADDITGLPYPVTIQFRQVLPDSLTASVIVIDQEFLTNLTGMGWGAFRMELVPTAYVEFDGANLPTNYGPFASVSRPTPTTLLFNGGGTVPNGGMWTPQNIRINVDLGSSDNPIIFQLKEIPLVPGPGPVALMGVGGVLLARRRR